MFEITISELIGNFGFISIPTKSFLNCLQIQYGFKKSIDFKLIPKKFSFVLGMHRSGTSALTGMLCNEGLLSPPIDLMEATDANEKGYVAPIDVLSIQEANEIREEIENIEKKWPNAIEGLGRN